MGEEKLKWREDRMNATPPAKKKESPPPDDVEAGYAKKAEAARGKKKMSQKLTAVGAISSAISTCLLYTSDAADE